MGGHDTFEHSADSRPYAGVYESTDATPVAFGVVTTDRGDVRELTDASGMPFAFYSYDAYGNPAAKLSGATSLIGADVAAAICSGNVVRYAGYVYDQESGLYYLSARYYDPSTASFLTKDPANADGEESAYQYCGGDPVGKVDPSGASTKTIFYTDTINATRMMGDSPVSTRIQAKVTAQWSFSNGKIHVKLSVDLVDSGDVPGNGSDGGIGGPYEAKLVIRKSSGSTYNTYLRPTYIEKKVPNDGKQYFTAYEGPIYSSNYYGSYWIVKARMNYSVMFWSTVGHAAGTWAGAWHNNPFGTRR